MQKRVVLDSPHLSELRKKRKDIFKKKIILYFSGIGVFFVIFCVLSYLPFFKIKEIQINGVKILEIQEIKDNINIKLKNHFSIFSKKNIFLYPKNKISNYLNNIPRVKDYKIYREGLNKIIIDITERGNKFIWCKDFNFDFKNQCYFMNDEGYILDIAPYFSGNVYFKFFGPLTKENNIPIGSYFIQDIFKNISIFKNNLEQINIKPVYFLLNENKEIEIYLEKKSDNVESPKIIMNYDSDFDKTFKNLQVALETEPLAGDFKNKYSSLLYIDLRYGNKVYYKFK
ncbi:FtsQ-type POTRA domain-containing protein [Candidatus Nomurabacteria bacterium]|nr:FtsQ-type POTRA domain-containing protein [Candidatus Nomurabacteria bacterium]